jgi:hypothetical protein
MSINALNAEIHLKLKRFFILPRAKPQDKLLTRHLQSFLFEARYSDCPSSNDLRLFVFLKIGVSGSVYGLI